ncbi:MAG: TIGR01777 family oxidoreductase [Actinomycetales bacterium]
MHILISGGSGLLGSALRRHFTGTGHRVSSLVRRAARNSAEIRWEPSSGALDPAVLDGVDAVINLCGASLGGRPWSPAYKEVMYSSRLEPVHTLVTALRASATPPAVFLSASATGYYGQHDADAASEDAPVGSNSLLADICRQWEAAAAPAAEVTRTVMVRTGVVLAPRGGALSKLLLPLTLGLGGPLGNGRQFWPWITLADYVAAIDFLLHSPAAGPVNLCSPEPASVGQLIQALGRELHRPTRLPVPAFVLRLGLGEMAEEMLLTSTIAVPSTLLELGFSFGQPDAPSAARWVAAQR